MKEQIMPACESNTSVFDSNAVLDLVDGDTEFVCELIETFLSDLPEQLGRLRESAFTEDYSEIRNVAHRLKSSVGNLGGGTSIPLFRELECQAAGRNESSVRELLPLVETRIERFQAELQNFRAACGC